MNMKSSITKQTKAQPPELLKGKSDEPTFQPSQSKRTISSKINVQPSTDRWEEYLTIVDLLNPRTNTYELQIRSFFESNSTNKKVWDEPPSGAKNVVWASDDMKEMAFEQMKDLKAIPSGPGTGNYARHDDMMSELTGSKPNNNLNCETDMNAPGKKKKFGWIRRNFPTKQKKEAMYVPRNLMYERGSKTDEFCVGDRSNGSDRKKSRANDVNLQHALAQSLINQRSMGIDGEENDNAGLNSIQSLNDDEKNKNFHGYGSRERLEEEEALAMAKALSLSESEYRTQDKERVTYDVFGSSADFDRNPSSTTSLKSEHDNCETQIFSRIENTDDDVGAIQPQTVDRKMSAEEAEIACKGKNDPRLLHI